MCHGRSVNVAAVILAAGASTRLGEPKQLVRLGGERLLERSVRVASAAGCEPVIVVLGASVAAIQRECNLRDVVVAINSAWSEGMGSSIRCGMQVVPPDCNAAILMTCDQPAVTPQHLRQLISQCDCAPVASTYANRRGVPACFPAESFAELRVLRGDEGARRLLALALAIDLPGGELDVDTREALEAARAAYS